jgi:hypothetical protein
MDRLIFLSVLIILLFSCSKTKGPDAVIRVDASQIFHTLKGGMGASWHAISKEMPLNNEKYKYPVREVGPRGSAYGGNPPVSDTVVWNQIKEHAAWLGLNFIRVELSQRMYEPERHKFDWENEEMQALYHILDWCQQNNADVFLQQMWGNIEWNAYPGVHPLISAPKNLDDFAGGIATLIEYLTKTKGYTCIKYFCMTNEPPGGPWGYWWEYGDANGSINDAWKRLKEEFDARRITIPISGPDWTSMPPFQKEKFVFASYLGSFDIHSYDGVSDEGEANLRRWAEWAHGQNKPFFMTEYGNMKMGFGGDHPGQKSFDAALSNATDVIRGLRAGVDGFNRWSFVNRGDLDGQWQLIQTFDRQTKQYLSKVNPEKEAYYGFGILSRFLSKYSSTISVSVSQPDSVLMSAALISPLGELSVFLVNLNQESLNVNLKIALPSEKKLNVYQVSKQIVSRPEFVLNALKNFSSSKPTEVVLPGRSITTITSYSLRNKDKGIIFQ